MHQYYYCDSEKYYIYSLNIRYISHIRILHIRIRFIDYVEYTYIHTINATYIACVCVNVCRCVWLYIFASYHISNTLLFPYYVYLIACQSLYPFIDRWKVRPFRKGSMAHHSSFGYGVSILKMPDG